MVPHNNTDNLISIYLAVVVSLRASGYKTPSFGSPTDGCVVISCGASTSGMMRVCIYMHIC